MSIEWMFDEALMDRVGNAGPGRIMKDVYKTPAMAYLRSAGHSQPLVR